MSKFAGLKTARSSPGLAVAHISADEVRTKGTRPSRQGKRMIGGHFSPELSRELNILAAEQGVSVQALLGEAFDLLFRHHGKHPFGER